jgi:hypothetical protein
MTRLSDSAGSESMIVYRVKGLTERHLIGPEGAAGLSPGFSNPGTGSPSAAPCKGARVGVTAIEKYKCRRPSVSELCRLFS